MRRRWPHKLVDDLKAARERVRVKQFMKEFNRRFNFGDVLNGVRELRFSGINTVQNVGVSAETNADENLDAVADC